MSTVSQWMPFGEDAIAFGIFDEGGLVRVPFALDRILETDAGVLDPECSQADAAPWASLRLATLAAKGITHGPAMAAPALTEAQRQRRLERVRDALQTIPSLAPAPTLRPLVTAFAIDVAARKFGLADADVTRELAEFGLVATAADIEARREAGQFQPDEAGKRLDARADQEERAAADKAKREADALAEAMATKPVTGAQLGVIFAVRRPARSESEGRALEKHALFGFGGVFVKDLDGLATDGVGGTGHFLHGGRKLFVFRTVGNVQFPRTNWTSTYRIAPDDEAFELTKAETHAAKNAPIYSGAIQYWREARGPSRPMVASDFLEVGSPALRAAIKEADRILDVLAPLYRDGVPGVLPAPEMLVRGLRLEPDVAAGVLVRALRRKAPGHAFAVPSAALSICTEALEGTIEIGECSPPPSIVDNAIDTIKDRLRGLVGRETEVTLDRAMSELREQGDDAPEGSPQRRGLVATALEALGMTPARPRDATGRQYRAFVRKDGTP